MKILIEFSETKREIDGSFMVCGSREDLRHIAHQVLNATAEEFAYGWVTIYADSPPSRPNSPAQPWDHAAAKRRERD